MASILPFKGLFYNPEKIEDISRVTAPPYDIITPDDADTLYSLSPYNIIRLILGKESDSDGLGNNKYTRASQELNNWIESGILVRDEEPSFYIYRQEYYLEEEKRTLTGIICTLKMEDSKNASPPILPHEKTLDKPRTDRLKLIRECRANLSPIFGLYRDRENVIDELTGTVLPSNPSINFKDRNETTHTVWKIADPLACRQIQEFLEPENILIADGHHRYAAASAYREEMLKTSPSHTGDEPYNSVMIYLSNLFSDGLTILPAHRLIKNLADNTMDALFKNLEEHFNIEEFSDYEELSKKMKLCRNHSRPVFGLYFRDKYLFAKLKSFQKYHALIGGGMDAVYSKLDVCIVHKLIIDNILNGGREMPQENMAYEQNPQKAINAVHEKSMDIAIFLNPTKIEQVIEIASSGNTLPGKATYFYPKPLCGLVLRKL